MANWYQEVFLQWPIALQWLAYVSLGLNSVVATWLFYDTQRYDGRLNSVTWAIGALACSSLSLWLYWRRTGSARAAMAFAVTLITGLVMTGMYDRPIQGAVDLQMEHTMQSLPVPGVNQDFIGPAMSEH